MFSSKYCPNTECTFYLERQEELKKLCHDDGMFNHAQVCHTSMKNKYIGELTLRKGK